MNYEYMTYSQDEMNKIEDPNATFFMVVKLGSDGCFKSDAMPSRQHKTIEEAASEAKRLAGKHPTHPRGFAVLQALAVYKGEVNISGKYLNKPNFLAQSLNELTDSKY